MLPERLFEPKNRNISNNFLAFFGDCVENLRSAVYGAGSTVLIVFETKASA